jgi:hypothetical protein
MTITFFDSTTTGTKLTGPQSTAGKRISIVRCGAAWPIRRLRKMVPNAKTRAAIADSRSRRNLIYADSIEDLISKLTAE